MNWSRVPLFLYISGFAGLAMLAPALLALIDGQLDIALTFGAAAVVTVVLAGMTGLAMSERKQIRMGRENLLALFGTFTLLPVALAWPLAGAVPGLPFIDAYVEMVSASTTTGFSLEPEPGDWPRAVHLWRAGAAWLTGFLTLVAAVAILAPMHLGGAELILPPLGDLRRENRAVGHTRISAPLRVRRSIEALWGIYLSLTFALWLLLVMTGSMPFTALCHAMSTISTSGISPVGGLEGGGSGLAGEIAVFLFFAFAISRRFFTTDLPGIGSLRFFGNPELRTAAVLVVLVTGMLFVRHWVAFVETAEVVGLSLIPRAAWGAIFTSASFLTTTGYVSENWEIARLWSGLSTPGMALLGLSLIGGGVATTAGGVKLLRIYVLYKHGQMEVSRLVHPSTVGGIGTRARPVRQSAAYMAWLLFMLIALTITLIMMALTLVNVEFETATVLTIAAIANNGPLAQYAPAVPIHVSDLTDTAKLILCGGMVLGKLETLGIIALLNPDFWRR